MPRSPAHAKRAAWAATSSTTCRRRRCGQSSAGCSTAPRWRTRERRRRPKKQPRRQRQMPGAGPIEPLLPPPPPRRHPPLMAAANRATACCRDFSAPFRSRSWPWSHSPPARTASNRHRTNWRARSKSAMPGGKGDSTCTRTTSASSNATAPPTPSLKPPAAGERARRLLRRFDHRHRGRLATARSSRASPTSTAASAARPRRSCSSASAPTSSRSSPHAVVILAGTNDIAGNTGPIAARTSRPTSRRWPSWRRAHGIRVVLVVDAAGAQLHAGDAELPFPAASARRRSRRSTRGCSDYAAANGCVYLDYAARWPTTRAS